jgi:hypothetical protein
MAQQTTCRIFTLFALVLLSASVALAQTATSHETVEIPFGNTISDTWQAAKSSTSYGGKLIVVTLDQPNRRQTCHIRSFTLDKLVCSRTIGGPRAYLPQQVLALILPGDGGLRLPFWLGANAGLGAAIWGTVVLAATCPACAVATGITALFFFGAAGTLVYGDDQPDRLLYLAPGQQLSRKLGYVQRG